MSVFRRSGGARRGGRLGDIGQDYERGHLGYVSQQNYERYYPDIVENIRSFLDGKPTRVIAPR